MLLSNLRNPTGRLNDPQHAVQPPRSSSSATSARIPQIARSSPLPMGSEEKQVDPALANLEPKDVFAKGLLHLDVGQLDNALEAFSALDSKNLVEFCLNSPSLLISPSTDGVQHPSGKRTVCNV